MTGGTPFVYLAEPIDQERGDGRASLWAKNARERLLEAGVGVFSPKDAFAVPKGGKPSVYIERVNHAALSRCAGVIAMLPAGVPTIGVPFEIQRAVQQSVPVAIITDAGEQSWSLTGLIGAHVFTPDEVQSAIAYLIMRQYDPAERKGVLPFKVEEGGKLPSRAYDDDAGLDLYVSEPVVIPVGQFRDVPCGVSVEMQSHHWGLIIGRSSTLRKRGLMVTPGIIDPGYRGELYSGVYNLGGEVVRLERGERVAQFILMGNSTQAHVPGEVAWLRESPRGENGFGSSGT